MIERFCAAVHEANYPFQTASHLQVSTTQILSRPSEFFRQQSGEDDALLLLRGDRVHCTWILGTIEFTH